MTTVNPYLTLRDNCEEAFNVYKSVFGGDFQFIGRYKDLPATVRQNFPNEADEKIMHISLPISDETILMGCDSSDAVDPTINAGNNFSLFISTDSKENADRIFNGLVAGGNIKMPMSETFWGAYFGSLIDRFGIQWSISTDLRKR